jgi:hypothetical protein
MFPAYRGYQCELYNVTQLAPKNNPEELDSDTSIGTRLDNIYTVHVGWAEMASDGYPSNLHHGVQGSSARGGDWAIGKGVSSPGKIDDLRRGAGNLQLCRL